MTVDNWLICTGISFFCLSALLFISVFWLISRLRAKRDQVANTAVNKAVFNKEICTLLTILCVFSSTYMVRGLWDIKTKPDRLSFEWMIKDMLLIGVFCDFVPIMPLLIFHYRNFKVKTYPNSTDEKEDMCDVEFMDGDPKFNSD